MTVLMLFDFLKALIELFLAISLLSSKTEPHCANEKGETNIHYQMRFS